MRHRYSYRFSTEVIFPDAAPQGCLHRITYLGVEPIPGDAFTSFPLLDLAHDFLEERVLIRQFGQGPLLTGQGPRSRQWPYSGSGSNGIQKRSRGLAPLQLMCDSPADGCPPTYTPSMTITRLDRDIHAQPSALKPYGGAL